VKNNQHLCTKISYYIFTHHLQYPEFAVPCLVYITIIYDIGDSIVPIIVIVRRKVFENVAKIATHVLRTSIENFQHCFRFKFKIFFLDWI